MSTPLYCRCGTAIETRTHWNGAAYVLEFRRTAAARALTRCPGCGDSLYCAFRAGDLSERAASSIELINEA